MNVDMSTIDNILSGAFDPITRNALFNSLDPIGSGNLKYSSILKWVNKTKGLEVFQRNNFLLLHAFNRSKCLKPSNSQLENETLQRSEFGDFLKHLRQNLFFAQIFERMDTEGKVKITRPIFEKNWPQLRTLIKTEIVSPEMTFSELDRDGNGVITIGEFLDWAWKRQLTAIKI